MALSRQSRLSTPSLTFSSSSLPLFHYQARGRISGSGSSHEPDLALPTYDEAEVSKQVEKQLAAKTDELEKEIISNSHPKISSSKVGEMGPSSSTSTLEQSTWVQRQKAAFANGVADIVGDGPTEEEIYNQLSDKLGIRCHVLEKRIKELPPKVNETSRDNSSHLIGSASQFFRSMGTTAAKAIGPIQTSSSSKSSNLKSRPQENVAVSVAVGGAAIFITGMLFSRVLLPSSTHYHITASSLFEDPKAWNLANSLTPTLDLGSGNGNVGAGIGWIGWLIGTANVVRRVPT